MAEPPVDIANFRAKAHAIAAEKKAERASEPFLGNEPKDGPAQVVTRRASDITPEPISWVWKYWLARGMLEIIGAPPHGGNLCSVAQSS
jgi:hypothetical protein